MHSGPFLCAAALALAARAGGDYEVQVGARTYAADEGRPVTVVTPRGEEMSLTVRLSATRTFHHDGLRFDYPAGMTKEEESLPAGFYQVSVETANSTLFIAQIYGVNESGALALQSFLDAVREQAKSMSGREPTEAAARREIGGRMVEGRKLVWTLGGLENTSEIYLLPDDTQGAVVLVFQADNEDRAEAEACFKVIAASLKRTTETRSPPAAK